ncbi:MAG: outer membrane protein assembly factor BamB family protein [Phycisphaerales bacterium]
MPKSTAVRSLLRAALLGLGAAALGLGAGCSSSPGERLSGSSLGSFGEEANASFAKLGYRPVWTGFATVTGGAKLESLTVLGDVVAGQDTRGAFSLISPTGGETRWATTVSTPQTRFLGSLREPGQVVICSDNEANFYDIDTSTLVAKQRFSRLINTRPVQFGPVLVAGTASGEVLGHLLTTGIRAWTYGVGGSFETSPVLLDDGIVGLVSSAGHVVFISASDGSSASRHRLAGGIIADPCGVGRTMFVASADQSIYAFDAYSPRPLWRRRTEAVLRESPAYHAGSVYVSIPGVGFSALDSSNGSIRWSTPGVSGKLVAINRGRLVVWNGREVVVLLAEKGDIVERQELPGVTHFVPDAFIDGNVYLGSDDGTVRKIAPR